MNFAPWQAAERCSKAAAPGALALREVMLARYPAARDMGIYNCRKVRGAEVRSIHAEGRAWDMGFPVVNGRGHPDGHAAVRELGAVGRTLGVQTIIFDRTIWSARSPSGRPYNGVNPHYDHLHIELTREAGASLTAARIRAVLGVPAVLVPTVRPTLRPGARGEHVRVLQRNLGGLAADGVFGPRTVAAVREFQRSRGLLVDGVVGPATWQALGV